MQSIHGEIQQSATYLGLIAVVVRGNGGSLFIHGPNTVEAEAALLSATIDVAMERRQQILEMEAEKRRDRKGAN
ncbi:MAG: hypothetical protein KJN79_09385 [Gammaproteobacteria bacterium]|nr:hypothetical protein [Gammaproteobacteria bacterium]